MTQYYAYKRFRLDRAPTSTRVLITAFYVMMALAVAVGVINYKVRTGLEVQGTVEWYRGNEDAGDDVTEMLFPKTVREMLDVTHPHLFEESLILFVLCHLFALTRVHERKKILVYILSFSAVLLDTGVPWLTRFVSPAFAPVHLASTALLAVMFLVLLGKPIHEMWFARDKEEKYDWVQH